MPRIKNKSKQYLFKNKANIRRKSKRELINESFFMFISGISLLLINYFIPKDELFNSFKKNILNILNNLFDILFYSLEILIVLLISFTILLSLFLIVGSVIRLFRVIIFKSKKISIRQN